MKRLAAILLLAGTPFAAGAEPPSPGVYGDVRLSAETGDLGGAELELIGSAAGARVELVICEGWCNAVSKAPVKFTEDGFTFEYAEQLYDEAGAPVEASRYRARAARAGEGISLTIVSQDPSAEPFTFYLPPISERFGLAVAAGD